MTRHQDVTDARAAADEWAAAHGLPPSGGYSGQWFLDGYLFGWWPDGWQKWWASYGIEPGSILGGDIVGHQYTSTPIDQSVFEDSEIGNGGDMADCQTYKDALARVVNRLQIEDERKAANGQPAALRRTIMREIASEAFAALES